MDRNLDSNSDAINSLLGKVIREINLKMGSGYAFEQLLDAFFDSLGLLIPFDRMGIALLEENRERIRLVWVRSKMPVDSLKKNYSSLLVSSSLKEIIDSGKPRIINDLEQYAQTHPNSESTRLILKDNILSSLTCPLWSESKAIGVVFFSSRFKNTYDNSHVNIFCPLADELSVIVEQAHLKNAFAEMEQKDRAFAKVLHDLRSPLNVIEGYLDLTASENWYESLPETIKDIFAILKRNTNSMVSLLDDISSMQSKEGTPRLMIKEIDLHDFCSELIASGRILARGKDIDFLARVAPGLPHKSEFDHNQIRRVVENLFSNAVKFSFRKTEIIFSVWHEDGKIYFSVADKGQGIKGDEIPRLFKEFGKTSTLPSEGEPSSGLGLCISKGIVEAHGGQIFVDSHFGQGSTFSFWIPIKK